MRFLLDEGSSPRVADVLSGAGHDVRHVRDLGLAGGSGADVLQAAADDDRVLLTLDTDFGTLLAHSGAGLPSVVLFRGDVTRRPAGQAELLQANLTRSSSRWPRARWWSSGTAGSGCAHCRSAAEQ